MGYISKFIQKRKAAKLVSRLQQSTKAPLDALPLLIELSHTIYDSHITIERSEGIVIDTHHLNIEALTRAIQAAVAVVVNETKPLMPVIDNPPVRRRLMDLCQVDSDGSYIYPDRLVSIIVPELEKLNYNLQNIDDKNASYSYYGRLVKYIIKDVHALAVCIYGEKYNNG